MREIKFRGKSMENAFDIKKGDWVIGSLFIDPRVQHRCDCNIWSEQFKYWVRVDPDTVGQLTSWFDENGRYIYEGDILHFDDGNNAEVYYCLDEIRLSYPFGASDPMDAGGIVIGNIHDNPELLKN